MTTTTTTVGANLASYLQWLDFYEEKFARISDSALTGYWYMYGRDSEAPGTPRDEAAYAAVNAEITARDMQP